MSFYKKYFMKQNMMRTVIISLVPIILLATYFQGLRVLYLTGLNIIFAVLTEFCFEKFINKKEKVSEAAIVTAIIYTMTLPVGLAGWISALGIIFGIFFGKMVFGGFGRNIFNPAALARAFVYINFPEPLTIHWNGFASLGDFPGGFARWIYEPIEAITTATPMMLFRNASGMTDKLSLFLGSVGGVIGETSGLLIILAAIYLIYKKVASWEIMAGSLLGFVAMTLVFNLKGVSSVPDPISGILFGGFLFGTVFMATDPISAAKTRPGKWIFGAIIGVVTVIIRGFALFSGGMMFAILIANTFAPIIDYSIRNLKLKGKVK